MTTHPRTFALLAQAGLAPVELKELSRASRHQMPVEPRGFGLIGPTGTCKTSDLARFMAHQVDGWVREQPDPARASMQWIDGEVVRDRRLCWVVWLKLAEELRGYAKNFERVKVERWAVWMEDAPLLVLDDIGREARDSNDDAAQAVLSRVLEHRYRHQMPLWWTSNRTREELAAFYGGPMASRLFSTWPDYEMGGQDMRLFPVDLKTAAGGEA